MREGIDSGLSSVKHAKHCEKLQNKLWALEGKQALLNWWEKRSEDWTEEDHEYVIKLRARVRAQRVSLLAMRPGKNDEQARTQFYESQKISG